MESQYPCAGLVHCFVGGLSEKKADVYYYAAAWRWRDLNPGPPSKKRPLYHLCYLTLIWMNKPTTPEHPMENAVKTIF